MKRWFYINVILYILLYPTMLIGQIIDIDAYGYDCENSCEANYDTINHDKVIYESKNGYFLSPHGEIRFIVAFIELVYDDPQLDPSPNGTIQWRPGEMPLWKDSLLSAFTPIGISDCHITKYYQYASSNNHIVLGDYLLSPTNNGVFRVNTSDGNIKGISNKNKIIEAINQQMSGKIITKQGLNSITYFDNWTPTNIGETKTNSGNNKWDFLVLIVRNSIDPSDMTGNTENESLPSLLGYGTDSYAIVCTNGKKPIHIIRHEYAHKLLGGNNFHTAGGGYDSPKEDSYGNYWIPVTGGWGLLGLYGSSLWCWNAWDRQRLGWIDSTSTYEISARNQDGTEVNGDLDATNPDDVGIYVLRDFVTTGDAIRIKLPYIDSTKEYQEWLWIENHQGVSRNYNEFDQWQYQEDFSCVEGVEPGLMMYIQINNDIRSSTFNRKVFMEAFNHADYTRALPANGLWDKEFLIDSVYINCVNYMDRVRPFVRLDENPFTGSEDQSRFACDIDNNNIIEKNDNLNQSVEFDGSTYHHHLYQLGHSSHSFNLNGNRKIGIGTNPSTATLVNMVGEEIPEPNVNNLRTTYLNGISVEMLEQCQNGDIKIRVRFDDVDIENDVRWCSDSIVLNPISTSSGYSLNLKSGKTIFFDQGLTATRMTNPIVFQNKKIFASPTTFTVMPDAKIHLESSSKIILDNKSKMHLSEQSSCVIEDAGYIEVKSGTVFQMDDCSILSINGIGKLIVRSGAELRISPNAILSFQNGNNNLRLESNVIIPSGYVDPRNLIHSDMNITTNRIYEDARIKIYKKMIIENGAVVTFKSSTIHFVDTNSGIIVKPGGKLIIDASILTSMCSSSKWRGIEVWGDDDKHQNLVGGQYHQGYLELRNGATIENAVCAVELWKPDDYSSEGGIIVASDAVFRNNAKAVHALNYTNYSPNSGNEMDYHAHFTRCSFIIDGEYAGDEMFHKHVDLYNIRGLCIEENSFTKEPSCTSRTYGIAVDDSENYNDIYLNHFQNLYCGTVAIGLNTVPGNVQQGLTYTCNTHSGNSNDIGVLKEDGVGNICIGQGSSSVGAGNSFSGTNYHFYNGGGTKLTYYYKGTGDKYPSRVHNMTRTSSAADNECRSHYFPYVGPGIGGGGDDMTSAGDDASLRSVYRNALSAYETLKSAGLGKISGDSMELVRYEAELSSLQREYLRAASDMVRIQLNKEERDVEELREWLVRMEDMSSDRMTIATYMEEGDFATALAIAKTLPDRYGLQGAALEEHEDYLEIIRLHEQLHETSRSALQLSDNEVSMLEEMAENGEGQSQIMARALLSENRGTLVLTNALGIEVMRVELEGKEGATTLDVTSLPEGVYICTVRCGEHIISAKMIVGF